MHEPIKSVARLYEFRDAAKLLLGHSYDGEMEKFGTTINSLSLRTHTGILEVANEWATAAHRDGTEDSAKLAITILAAAVELLELSKEAA